MFPLRHSLFIPARLRLLGSILACAFAVAKATAAAVLLQDGFESGVLGTQWTTSATNDGRITVTTDFAPASGARHLVLDDAVNDTTYSVAEATLRLDLTAKNNVVLTFQAKGLGNESHSPPTSNFSTTRTYDGVAISTNGGSNWRSVQSLASVSGSWQTFSVRLDDAVFNLNGKFGPDFRIRFSGYDNSAAPVDGIAIDDVVITAEEDWRSHVEVPTPLFEGTGAQTGLVKLNFAPASDLTLNLITTPAGELVAPSTVVVPAGQTSASFEFSVPDDDVVNLTRDVKISATAPGVVATAGTVTLYDDEAPIPTLTLPAQLVESDPTGASNRGTAVLSISHAAARPLTCSLSANPSLLNFQGPATIPAGQTQVTLGVYAQNNYRFDGDVVVTVTAAAPGIQTATAQTTVIDNDPRNLSVTLPDTIQEDGVATGSVAIPATLSHDLTVSLSSSNSAAASVPSSVVIAAGSFGNNFTVTPSDNSAADGSRTVVVTAEAQSFNSGSAVTTIRDNEIVAYRVAVATDIVNVAAPVSFTVSALDIEENAITGVSKTVNVAIVQQDGSSAPATPPTLMLTGATTTGSITVPAGSPSGLRIRVSDPEGITAHSQFFDTMRSVTLTASDLVWDPPRKRFYASVPTSAPARAGHIVAIDAASGEITASVFVGNNPAQLALTSGGEALYVAQMATGTITRINPETMSVVSSFPLGTSSNGTPLIATDIMTMPDQPNVLVVVRYANSSLNPYSVAAYDLGVRRLKVIDFYHQPGIERSADSAIFFIGATSGLRRARLDLDGPTFVASSEIGVLPQFVAEADLVTYAATLVDGANFRRLGNLLPLVSGNAPGGRPDAVANRVYLPEQASASYSAPFDKLSSFDPQSLAAVRRATMPSVSSLNGLIRWGATGLAFRTSNAIGLVNATQLVPTSAPTDLRATLEVTPRAASVGNSLVYEAQMTNAGAHGAPNALLTATLSDGQSIEQVTGSGGLVSVSGSVITLFVDNLPAGASASLTIRTAPQAAGSVSCRALVTSNAIDPNFRNDAAFALVPVSFSNARDVLNRIRLDATNLLYDAGRKVIWATIPSTVPAPLGRSVVAIDPTSGQISAPIPFAAEPRARSLTISGNGRYLYFVASDLPEVVRIDLSSTPPAPLRIPLASFGTSAYGQDLEVLDGDGTSFIITGDDSSGVAVYDGAVRRAKTLSLYVADRIERTTTPNVFVGLEIGSSGPTFSRLAVDQSGVTSAKSTRDIIGASNEMVASGDLVLTDAGHLGNAQSLTLETTFGLSGRPCLDAPNNRAYLVSGNALRAFDLGTGTPAGSFEIPDPSPVPSYGTTDWARTCIRWGTDGFAIAGAEKIYLTRWSGAAPGHPDQNGDHISDAWAISYFGTADIDLGGDGDRDGIANAFEYLFATSPVAGNASPLQIGIETAAAGEIMHLIFPRRADLAPLSYRYEISEDVAQWSTAFGVTETVIGTQTIDGVEVQIIDAAIPAPNAHRSFARLIWLTP